MVVYFASDLIWSSRIRGVASDLQAPARAVRSVQELRAMLVDADAEAMLVDLASSGTALDLIRAFRTYLNEKGPPTTDADTSSDSKSQSSRLIAFGPHVDKALFQQARDAGADEVTPYGAMAQRLPAIIRSLTSVV